MNWASNKAAAFNQKLVGNWKLFLLLLLSFEIKGGAAQVYSITEDPKYLPREEAFRNRISKEILISYFDGNNRTDSVISRETYYDSAGKVIEVRGFSGGRFSQRIVYMYTGGRLTSVYEDAMSLGYKMDYKISYDSAGRPFEEHRQIRGKPFFLIFRYVFDTSGRLVSINRSFNGEAFEPFLKYYYEQGKLVRKEEFTNPKQLAFAEAYSYGTDGRVTKYFLLGRHRIKGSESFYNKSGQLVKRVIYAGEPFGTWVTSINPDRAVRYYDYNPNKTISTIHFGSRQRMKGRTVYNYF